MGGTLEGQTILVIGAGGGMGRAVCEAIAGEGAAVAVADIAEPGARAVADAVARAGGRSLALAGDITAAADAERLVAQTVARFGRLDGLVNMVGYQVFANLLDLEEATWDRLIDVNLKGPFLISAAAARAMKGQAGGGRIIHFASVTSLFGSPGQAPYAAAKAGLCNLVKSMALEWAPHGIRVNAVSPVMTETPINTKWLNEDPQRKEKIARKIPRGRLGTPADFAGAVKFLLSADADFVLGQTFYIDGGTSVVHPLIGG